jgi:ribosomal protein S27AE
VLSVKKKSSKMNEQNIVEAKPVMTSQIRVKTTERNCPNCDAVLVLNDNEQCYECFNCGYIDCGEEE